MVPPIKSFNNYEIRGETTVIFLKKRSGETFETIIDTEDLQKVKDMGLHWHVRYAPNTKSYYAKATRRLIDENSKSFGESVYLHIELLGVSSRSRLYVDHENHDTLDNRKSNLRITENNENLKHRSGRNTNNTTGYRNVSKIDDKYVVQLQVNGKNTVFGRFDTPEEAAEVAEQKRKDIYGEFAGIG